MKLLELPLIWVTQDLVVLVATGVLLWFEQRREQFRGQRLLELLAFCFLYAAVFENGAVLAGRYDYGRSLLMIGAVPFSVPALEFTVLIASLRLAEKMRLPPWARPWLVGFFGMLQDFSLDPLAVRQVFSSEGRSIGRWTWFYGEGHANLFRVPPYNFVGWVFILGIGAAFLLLGRLWYERSGRRAWVGVLGPFVMALASLVALVLPTSAFGMWLGPFFTQGSAAEWVMLGVHFVLPLVLLGGVWRGRMLAALDLREDWPVVVVPALFHAMDLAFALAGGFFEVVPLQLAVTALHVGIVALVWVAGTRKHGAPAPRALNAPSGLVSHGPVRTS